MARILVLIAFVLLMACAKKNSSETANPADTLSSNVSPDSPQQNASGDFPSFLSFLDSDNNSVPVSFYPFLGLDPEGYEDNRFDIVLKSKITGDRMVVMKMNHGCTPILCSKILRSYWIDETNKKIIQSIPMEFNFETDPKYSLVQDMFVLITDRVHTWESDDNDVMKATAGPFEADYLIVLFENEFSKTDELSFDDLRIVRNYIFAKYGYKFTSEDLRNYFHKFDWYKPQFDNVDAKLTTEDKRIIKLIQSLEKK